MTTLDAQDLARLAAELATPAYAGLADRERFERLHAPGSLPNPEPAPPVPAPFSLAGLMTLLSSASRARIRHLPTGVDLVAKINAGDRAGVLAWIQVLRDEAEGVPPIIAAQEAGAVLAALSATVPDPSHPATVPGPSRKEALFPGRTWARPDGSAVDFIPLDDIREARP